MFPGSALRARITKTGKPIHHNGDIQSPRIYRIISAKPPRSNIARIRSNCKVAGCHCWLAQQCFNVKVRHCWTSQQWHPRKTAFKTLQLFSAERPVAYRLRRNNPLDSRVLVGAKSLSPWSQGGMQRLPGVCCSTPPTRTVRRHRHTVTECDTHRSAIGWQPWKSRAQATAPPSSHVPNRVQLNCSSRVGLHWTTRKKGSEKTKDHCASQFASCLDELLRIERAASHLKAVNGESVSHWDTLFMCRLSLRIAVQEERINSRHFRRRKLLARLRSEH